MPEPTTLWNAIRPLVFIGWGIAAVRLALEFVAPDASMYVGVYYLMPIVLIAYSVKKRFDDLLFLRLMLGMLIVGVLVWGLPNFIAYSTAQFQGWEHGRFAAGRSEPLREGTAARLLAGISIAWKTSLVGTFWMAVWSFFATWIPGALRRRRGRAAAPAAT